MACVFYFRGLNTYAEDHVRIGPLRAGTMYGPLQAAFQKKGILFIPLLDMKTGRLQDTIERAGNLLIRHPQWENHRTIDFFAHSTGALIARALLHDPRIRRKTRSLLSVGAPHQGAPAVDRLHRLAAARSRWLRLAKSVGWDWARRQEIIGDLSPASIEEFNRRFPDLPEIKYLCALCACPRQQLSLVMKLFEKIALPPAPNDGLIPLASQRHGEVLGEYVLDHFTQLGYFPFADPRLRKAHQNEFCRLVESAVKYWSSS